VSRKRTDEGGLGFRVDLCADGRVAEVWRLLRSAQVRGLVSFEGERAKGEHRALVRGVSEVGAGAEAWGG